MQGHQTTLLLPVTQGCAEVPVDPVAAGSSAEALAFARLGAEPAAGHVGAQESSRIRALWRMLGLIVPRTCLLVAALILLALASTTPWLDISASGLAFAGTQAPHALLLVGVAWIGLACAWVLVLSGRAILSLPVQHRCRALCVLSVAGLSIVGIEYGYLRPGRLELYEYRQAFRLMCSSLAALMLAFVLPSSWVVRVVASPQRGCVSLPCEGARPQRSHLRRGYWLVILALGAAAISATIAWCVLDAMPHIIDGTSYLLQARTLVLGQLTLEPPLYPDLFSAELMQFRITDAGYFSKYPVGWPIVLGVFDRAGVPWLANPILLGLLVVVTYLVVAERASTAFAMTAAAIIALTPWLWFNAATMMSHLASALWLWVTVWLLLRAQRTQAWHAAALAGLAFGAAVLTRPADAAFFAIPGAFFSAAWLIRNPRVWGPRLGLLMIATLPGVLSYLWINHQLLGQSGQSAYGGQYTAALFSQAPQSIGYALAWLHQSWVGLSTHWFADAWPLAFVVIGGAAWGMRYLRGQGLVLACAASLFVCYAVFVFGGRAWVGPRWYVPLAPGVAVVMAAGLHALVYAARSVCATPAVSRCLSLVCLAGLLVFTVALPAKLVEYVARPPHGIDGRVVRAVQAAGLTHAVVALPEVGLDSATGQPNYKRGIAGMWAMQAPFEDSPVIYIAAIEGWQAKARQAWPQRTLYQMSPDTGDYTLKQVGWPRSAAASPPPACPLLKPTVEPRP